MHPFDLKKSGRRFASITAYDYPTGRFADEAGIELILVGDSLGMVVLGYEDTTSVTMADMLHHVRAVRRAVKSSTIAADLPYRSYDTPESAVANARALLDAGAHCVKIEGGRAIEPQLRALVQENIPVIGHLGMLPQHIHEEGGYRRKGKTDDEARTLLEDAQLLESLGVKAIVLEIVVPEVARKITESITIPTIGIGSGKDCDAEIRVFHDIVGLFPWFKPAFAESYAEAGEQIRLALEKFAATARISAGDSSNA